MLLSACGSDDNTLGDNLPAATNNIPTTGTATRPPSPVAASPTVTTSATPEASATKEPGATTPLSPAPTTTPPSSTTAAPTATPTAQDAPSRSIAAGEWTYDYYLVGNTCDAEPGKTYLPVTQVLEAVTGVDGYISDGEQMRVYSFNGGSSLGTITFQWPTLSYQVPLNEPGGIRTEVTHTYFDARSGSSRVVEVYARGTGTCELTYAG